MAVNPVQDQDKTATAAAKAVITSLQLALKMLALYAEDHAYCQKSVVRLQREIEAFLAKYGTLILEIRSDRILCEGEIVHEGTAKDGELSFALFRDGMQEVGFIDGIEPEETRFLVKTIDRYKSLATTAEGDIVTALWEARLPHIHYVAADNILEIEQGKQTLIHDSMEIQIPQLPTPSLHVGTPGEGPPTGESSLAEVVEPIDLKPIASATLQLTAEEADYLDESVRSEEERDATQEILDMMGDILKDQKDEEFFAYILEYMLEEFKNSLKQKEFDIGFRIMQTLHHVRTLSEESRPWALTRVHGFFNTVAQPQFLEGLREILSTLSAAQIRGAGKVLGLLSPVAIVGIGPALADASEAAAEMLSDVLVSLASRDIHPMEQLLDAAEEPLAFRLAPLLARVEGKRSAQLLLTLARYPSERVRIEVLRAIIQRRQWTPERMGFLLEDQSNLVRRITIKYLGTRKSEAAEGLLSKHIRNGKFDGSASGELIACFKALGKCGTERSLPFLKEILLKGGWISRFRTSALRQGAAMALAEFGTERSLEILQEAAKSPFPAVRSAAQAVYGARGEEQ
ncbi:MAG: HEAT repeat domain-containing protein [Deltaproteobacteria bacterium]